MADNTTLAGGDIIRDLARQAGTIKTQTFQLDLGGPTGNAEKLITAGQQTMANSMPVVLASDQPPVADISAAGSLAALNDTAALALNGQSMGLITLQGTWVGKVSFEAFDGTTWFAVNGIASSTSAPASKTTANGAYRITPAGFSSMRVKMAEYTSGTCTVVLRATVGSGGFYANQIVPTKATDNNTGKTQKVHTFGSAVTSRMLGLVNTTFYTATAVADNYTTAFTGSGSANSTTTDGFFVLASGTTASSSAQMTSRDSATYNGIGPLLFLNGARLPQLGAAGVVRRWGAYDANNGYFFEDNAGVLRVVSRKATVDTAIASGSFNGLLGLTYALDTNGHFFEIEMTGGRAVFMIDQNALHTLAVPDGSTTSSASLNLPIRCEVINTPGVTNFSIEGRGQNIARLGEIDSKRLTEGLFDITEVEMARSVMCGRSAADTYNNVFVSAAGVMRVEGQAGATLAQDGTDITTPTAMPAGGVGIRGWLSAIWTKLNGTLGVTGTFWQATQPVSLATNTPTLQSGSTTAVTQATGTNLHVVVDTAPTTAVTGTFWQATQPISSALQLPAALGANTSAASLPVALSSDTATGTITTQNLVPAGVATASSAVEITLNGAATLSIQITTTGAGVLSLQATLDNTNWVTLGGTPLLNINTGAFAPSIASTLAGVFQADVGGFTKARITALSAASPTTTVTLRTGSSASMVALDAPVTATPATLAVTVTAAANTGATLTLPAPGAGLFHYITGLEITRNATAALAGTATLVITTTNLPGSLAWSVGNAMTAGGTQPDVSRMFDSPFKSSVANTATTIVMPAPGLAVLWRANVYYYTAP